MKRWIIGNSTSRRENISEELFSEFSKSGFGAMDITLRYPKKEENISADERFSWYKNLDTSKIRKWSSNYGVDVWAFHLPFGHTYYNIASLCKDEREYTVEKQSEILAIASETGAKIAVIHPSGEPITDIDRETSMDFASESLVKLADVAKRNGLILAVENLPRTCLGRDSKEIKKLIDADSSLRACFDVNHLLQESHCEFVNNIGDKIVTLHISDYDFNDEKHWIPGFGKIDWQELIELIKNIGYSGPFMNEIACNMNGETIGNYTFAEVYAANESILKKYF